MTTFERDAKTLELPWQFTGREDELELIRRSLTVGHHGIVVTGPTGCGKTRLVTEAVRGSDRARAAGTPETRHIPFAAFAHLLPEAVTLHRHGAVAAGLRLRRGLRLPHGFRFRDRRIADVAHQARHDAGQNERRDREEEDLPHESTAKQFAASKHTSGKRCANGAAMGEAFGTGGE